MSLKTFVLYYQVGPNGHTTLLPVVGECGALNQHEEILAHGAARSRGKRLGATHYRLVTGESRDVLNIDDAETVDHVHLMPVDV